MTEHAVVSQQQWLESRKAFLDREKELTHLRDTINQERMALPWARVEENYTFDTPEGKKSLAGLFDGRSQMVVYHFMYAPGWEAGCPGCSFMADHFDGTLPHLNHHDVTLMTISRAPLSELEAYKKRMNWYFPWVSSADSDFNYDYQVSFRPEDVASGKVFHNFEEMPVEPDSQMFDLHGLSAFFKDEDGQVYRTYSSYERGHEDLLGTLMILDRAPKGRNEDKTMDFLRRHDEYEDKPQVHACCSSVANA